MATYNLKRAKRLKGDARDEALEKYCLKKFNKQKHKTRPVLSLQDESHYLSDGDYYGAGYTEFGFYEVGEMTDEEIQEEVDDMREEIRSPYDCTGRRFTQWITWHRNPNGLVSVVHKFGIDV